MSLKFMYFTNQPKLAQVADQCGIDFVVVDLEIIGKLERQGHLNTRVSHHQIEDISPIRDVLQKSRLMVRINPIHNGSEEEINSVLAAGADVIMLPFFKTVGEVRQFLKFIDKRCKTCLLFETDEAELAVQEILELPDIDMVHVGINDLSLSKGMKFLFEPLLHPEFDKLCQTFQAHHLPFGFGGIAQLNQGAVPAQLIIAEHKRLGSSMVILARSFIDLDPQLSQGQLIHQFSEAIDQVRSFEKYLAQQPAQFFSDNQAILHEKIKGVIHG